MGRRNIDSELIGISNSFLKEKREEKRRKTTPILLPDILSRTDDGIDRLKMDYAVCEAPVLGKVLV